MKQLFKLVFFIGLMLVLTPATANADLKSAGQSATVARIQLEPKYDNRAKILKSYLERKQSPLASYADVFVASADKYKLDWRLVAAISGTESSFGLAIPSNSYNGWGWGVYGNNVHRFQSWPDAIETISKGLREKYINRWGAKDIYGIGRIYAASPFWAAHTIHFIDDIDRFSMARPEDTLSLSL